MEQPKLLPAPKQYIVHGVNSNTGIKYAVRPLSTWYVTDTERAVPYLFSTDCEREAAMMAKQRNDTTVTVYRPHAHPPRIIPTPATAHWDMAKERYLNKHPNGSW